MNVFYSTPAAYTAAKHAYNVSWPLKTDDFFPYADCPTCYWTGALQARLAKLLRGITNRTVNFRLAGNLAPGLACCILNTRNYLHGHFQCRALLLIMPITNLLP